MTLFEKLASGKKVFTAEITPPKGAGVKKLLERAHEVGPYVDALNVTDCQRSLVRMSSLIASKILLDHGYEPVFQMTCRDRNTIALQADLMGAAALKIPNLLCLTGDPVKVGDSPNSRSVFEVESTGLLKIVDKLAKGTDNHGHKLNLKTKFFVGAVVNPTLKTQSQYDRMVKKIECGANFFQTQANYDNDDFENFLKESQKLKKPVLAGILLLHSYEAAFFIKHNIPGIQMPDSVLKRFEQAKELNTEEETAIQFALESMKQLESYCDGFHLMSIRAEHLIPKLVKAYI